MRFSKFVRTRKRCRCVIYTVLCAGLAIQVIYSLAFAEMKQNRHGTYKDRHLLEADEFAHKDHEYQVGENEQFDFLTDWNIGVPDDRNDSKCKNPSTHEFLPTMFTEEQKRHGAILLHFAIATYICIAIAVVCDYYFVPSLEVICFNLNIQDDVGGATLMCIGSSFPDICAAMLGVMLTNGDIGIGTAMGASVFNILFVVGFCGILAHEPLTLTWWPFTRDMLWYCCSVIILSVVIFNGDVVWQEATIMICFYLIYLIMLWQNKRIEKKIYLLIGDEKSYQARFEDVVMKNSLINGENDEDIDDLEVTDTSEDYDYCGYPQDPPKNIFECPDSNVILIISWIVVLPLKILFFLTIPDLRRPKCQKFVSLTFIIGMAWIGFLTYGLLWMVKIIGHTLDIPDSVMGITFVALGTSVPDWFCSVLVARKGRGDMAVSQSVAGNTMGVLVGLGVPWLLKSLTSGRRHVNIESVGMLFSSLSNIFIALITLLVFKWRKFVLDRKLGLAMVAVYIIYLICSTVVELKVYSKFRLPLCSVL